MQNELHNTLIKADLVLCLIWTGSYQKATEYYAKYEKELNRVEYIPRNIAKAFYEMGMYSKAELLYDQALLNDQSDGEALKGLVYSLCQKENYTHAKQIIERYSIQSIIAHDIINSLNAYVLQKEGKYMQAYILFMKLNLTEEKEYTVKELQDKRKEIFSHLTKEEIGLLEEEYRKNSIFSGIIAMDRGQYGFLSSTDTGSLDECSYGLLLELAWDHFKAQRDEKAIEVYRFIMNTWPSSCLARIGSVYPLSRKGMLEESQKLLTWAYEHDCFLIDALFSEAFMYEKKRDFLKAIEVYDRILEKKPHHTAALKLKIRNIADLGMISSAYQLAQQEGIKDERFISDLESDMIIDRLKWEEENEAISLLEQQLKDYSENYRVLCDYIVALRKKERMEEVIEQFENVKSMGKPIF